MGEFEISVEVSGEDLEEIPERIRGKVTPKFMEFTGECLKSRMMTYAPVNLRSSRPSGPHLYETIEIKRQGNQYIYKIDVGPTAPYTPYVIMGTAPHFIFPVNARVLRFEVEGQAVFTPHVWHPGTKPNPFTAKAQQDYFEDEDELWKIAWEEEFK